MRKYIKYWPIALILLLIITNPSISEFKAYTGSNTYKGLRRPINLFILSEYSDRGEKYLGFIGNFVEIPRIQYASNAPVVTVKQDSSTNVDTAKKTDPFAEFGGHEIK